MRFVDPYNEQFQDIAALIYDTPEGFKVDAAFKLKLQEALIYDAVMMFADAVNSYRYIAKPRVIDCENSEDNFVSGTALVNQMKSVRYYYK